MKSVLTIKRKKKKEENIINVNCMHFIQGKLLCTLHMNYCYGQYCDVIFVIATSWGYVSLPSSVLTINQL